jgi:hypothetical protein
MIQTTTQTTTDAWHDHWKNTGIPAINLFENGPVSNAVSKFWWTQFLGFNESIVLDIGAGSGALAALALQQKIRVGRWICLDPAESASTHWPKQKSDLYNPTWITGSLENCTPTAIADVLISNFGVEYSDLTTAAVRARTWAGEHTKIAWVVHAKSSVIDEQSHQSLADLDFLFNNTSFKSTTLALIGQTVNLPTDSTERMMHGVQERDAFNNQANRLKTYMEQANRRSPALVQCLQFATLTIAGLVQGKSQIDQAVHGFTALMNALEHEINRLKQMNSVALDEKAIRTLGDSLQINGFPPPRIQPLFTETLNDPSSQKLIAWTLLC